MLNREMALNEALQDVLVGICSNTYPARGPSQAEKGDAFYFCPINILVKSSLKVFIQGGPFIFIAFVFVIKFG